jgi:hypothetical protein
VTASVHVAMQRIHQRATEKLDVDSARINDSIRFKETSRPTGSTSSSWWSGSTTSRASGSPTIRLAKCSWSASPPVPRRPGRRDRDLSSRRCSATYPRPCAKPIVWGTGLGSVRLDITAVLWSRPRAGVLAREARLLCDFSACGTPPDAPRPMGRLSAEYECDSPALW